MGLVCQRVQMLRPVQIQYFAIHRDESSGPAETVLAAVLLPQQHPERFCIGKPVELWSLDLLHLKTDLYLWRDCHLHF